MDKNIWQGENEMSYFSGCKKGKDVWDRIYGEGKIDQVHDDHILVTFPKSIELRVYTKDGNCEDDYLDVPAGSHGLEVTQRLFYFDERPIEIMQKDLGLSADGETCNIFCDVWFVNKDNKKEYKTFKYIRKIHRENYQQESYPQGRLAGHEESELSIEDMRKILGNEDVRKRYRAVLEKTGALKEPEPMLSVWLVREQAFKAIIELGDRMDGLKQRIDNLVKEINERTTNTDERVNVLEKFARRYKIYADSLKDDGV